MLAEMARLPSPVTAMTSLSGAATLAPNAAPGAKPSVSHPRNLVVVERNARVSVIEAYAAIGDGIYWTNAVSEVIVGEDQLVI